MQSVVATTCFSSLFILLSVYRFFLVALSSSSHTSIVFNGLFLTVDLRKLINAQPLAPILRMNA